MSSIYCSNLSWKIRKSFAVPCIPRRIEACFDVITLALLSGKRLSQGRSRENVARIEHAAPCYNGLKRPPADLFSTTGGQHRSEVVGLLSIGTLCG